MSSLYVSSLEKIINKCLRIKHKLAPESETDDKKRIMEKIRAAFPQLQKPDCTTPYTCIKLVIATAVKTLPAAKKLIPKSKQLIPYLFKRDSYSSSEIHFGQIRAIFNESAPTIRNYVHNTMRTTANQKVIQGAKADERVEKKLLDPFRISLQTFLENIARDAESNSFGVLLSALESASGARAIELISKKVAKFELIPNLPGFVRQTGQAKTRGKKVPPITKPIIGMKPDRFLERLAYARKFTDADVDKGFNNAELARKYEPEAVAYVQSIYPELAKGSGTHVMRAVYSKASYMLHNPNEEIAPSQWMKNVLGHGSYNSLKNYDSVIVTRGSVVKPADVPMAISEIEARVTALEAVRSDEQGKKGEEVYEVLINKKKRKLEDEQVDFTTIDNKTVSIKKLKRVRNKSEEESKNLVLLAEELLRTHNVKVTKVSLKSLGIGSSNVSKYRTK